MIAMLCGSSQLLMKGSLYPEWKSVPLCPGPSNNSVPFPSCCCARDYALVLPPGRERGREMIWSLPTSLLPALWGYLNSFNNKGQLLGKPTLLRAHIVDVCACVLHGQKATCTSAVAISSYISFRRLEGGV